MQEIKFGMLQSAKAKEISAHKAGVAAAKIGQAEDIYTQYKNMLNQMDGQQGSSEGGAEAFSVSVNDLTSQINAKVDEFNNYYAIINEPADNNNQNINGDNEEEKNKIPPKEFGSLMA